MHCMALCCEHSLYYEDSLLLESIKLYDCERDGPLITGTIGRPSRPAHLEVSVII
jgi:hypothetical protein